MAVGLWKSGGESWETSEPFLPFGLSLFPLLFLSRLNSLMVARATVEGKGFRDRFQDQCGGGDDYLVASVDKMKLGGCELGPKWRPRKYIAR